MARTEFLLLQLQGQRFFPIVTGSLLFLFHKRASLFLNIKNKNKIPILLIDACFSLDSPQNKTSDGDGDMGS